MATRKTTKPTTKKRSVKPNPGGYTIALTANNESYTSAADTLNGALLGLPQLTLKTKATLVVEHQGKQSRPIVLMIPNYRRLFYPGMTGEVQRSNFVKRYSVLA